MRAAKAPSRMTCAARMPPRPKSGTPSGVPNSASVISATQPVRPQTASRPKATMMPGVTMAEAKSPTSRPRPGKRSRLSAHASAMPTISDRIVVSPAWMRGHPQQVPDVDAARVPPVCSAAAAQIALRTATTSAVIASAMAAAADEAQRPRGAGLGHWSAARASSIHAALLAVTVASSSISISSGSTRSLNAGG